MMNARFNNNSAAPCCFASIEPNSSGNGNYSGNSHVQVLFTIHCPNGRIPDGFVAYLNNCIWTVGCQPKASAIQRSFQDVSRPANSKNITCRPTFDFNWFCNGLLYMMKDARKHENKLNYSEQRRHHSRIQIGTQPGGLMISYLPHSTDGYRTFFGEVRVPYGWGEQPQTI